MAYWPKFSTGLQSTGIDLTHEEDGSTKKLYLWQSSEILNLATTRFKIKTMKLAVATLLPNVETNIENVSIPKTEKVYVTLLPANSFYNSTVL